MPLRRALAVRFVVERLQADTGEFAAVLSACDELVEDMQKKSASLSKWMLHSFKPSRWEWPIAQKVDLVAAKIRNSRDDLAAVMIKLYQSHAFWSSV